MQCKNCGHDIPEPPTRVVVTETIREVDRSEGHYWVRAALIFAGVFVVLILTLGAVDVMSRLRDMKAFGEPSIKVEITEYDGAGRPVKKLSR